MTANSARSRNVTRRAVLGAGLATGVTALVASPSSVTKAYAADLSTYGDVIDPSGEIAPPAPEAWLWDVPTISPEEARRLTPSTVASRAGGGRLLRPGQRAAVPFSFRYEEFEIRDLSDGIRPYHLSSPLPLVDTGTHDAEGVRMANLGGVMYDHPVAQAQYGLNLMESFRITGDRTYLDRARKQAQRLVDRRVERDGGWFFPYPFNHRMHGSFELLRAPWYSMMAQGQALSLFCRLSRVPGEESWRDAADATFASYLVPPVVGQPWGVYVLDGLLWLEEYAFTHAVGGDMTYNGHTFSAYGLWDYWVISQSADALVLLRGALTTTRDVYYRVRNRHWRSKYCLGHARDAGRYHTTHIGQLLQVWAITGDPHFAALAELSYTDFPVGASGTILFQAGRHTGYRFNRDGKVLSRKTITLSRRSNAPSTAREKVRRQTGLWYSISRGSLAGFQVREVRQQAYQVGTYAAIHYRVPRPCQVLETFIKAYTIDNATGQLTSEVTEYVNGDPITVDARAAINGVEHFRLADGPHAGRWVGYSKVRRL
jgi:hypothetical protein